MHDEDSLLVAAGAFFLGILFAFGVCYVVMPGATESCRDQRDVERLCIDGNVNACRVMESRRG